MEEPENTSCSVCRGDIARCYYCKTFIFCQSCGPNTEDRKARHWDFCGPIQQRRAEYLALRDEERQPIQTRGGLCLLLAEKRHELVHLMFKAAYPEQLPMKTINGMVELFNYQPTSGCWNFTDAKLALPALYICQGRDRYAFDYALHFLNSRVLTDRQERHLGPFSFLHDTGPQIRFSILVIVDGLIRADESRLGFFRVPLVSCKFRVLSEIRQLERNPARFAALRQLSYPRCLWDSHNHQRRQLISSTDARAIIHQVPLAQRITGLEDEIRTLARFQDSTWRNVWRHLCLPTDCDWRQQNPVENMDEEMQKVIYANRHAWAGVPGECEDMVNLLELWR